MFKTETQHALRAVAALAHGSSPLSIAQIAEKTRSPAPMLGKVLYRLAQQGLVAGRPGPGGGYRLTRPPDQIGLAEIVTVSEGPNFGRSCLFGLPDCADDQPCPLHAVWGPARQRLLDMIEQHTVADLAGGRISNP